MSFKALAALDVLEAKLTDVDYWLKSKLRRVWRKVPRLHSVTT